MPYAYSFCDRLDLIPTEAVNDWLYEAINLSSRPTDQVEVDIPTDRHFWSSRQSRWSGCLLRIFFIHILSQSDTILPDLCSENSWFGGLPKTKGEKISTSRGIWGSGSWRWGTKWWGRPTFPIRATFDASRIFFAWEPHQVDMILSSRQSA